MGIVLCFTRPNYQVSVHRTIGPLVLIFKSNQQFRPNVHAINEKKGSYFLKKNVHFGVKINFHESSNFSESSCLTLLVP